MTLLERLKAWWRQPRGRDRVLAVLRDAHAEGHERLQGRVIGDRGHCRGTCYVYLRDLEEQGLVASRVAPELTVYTLNERPLQRRVYWLTTKGRFAAKEVEWAP